MALYFIMYNVCKYLWNTKSSKPKKKSNGCIFKY